MAIEGIDISKWQSTTPSLTGRGFVFAKASQADFADPMYATHAAHVRAAGLVLGAYHYVTKGTSAATQAQRFLAVAGRADLWALDLEGDANDATGRAITSEIIDRIQATGRLVGLYHSLSGYPNLGQDWRWVAYWSATAPSIAWDFWQYRGSPLDLDRWHGTAGQLAALVDGVKGGQYGMELTNIKGEDWKPSGAKVSGAIFAKPTATAAKLATVTGLVRSIAEVKGNDGGSWRLVEYPTPGTNAGRQVGFIRYKAADGTVGDWLPVLPGGDPAVDLPLQKYVARQAAGASQDDLAAAQLAGFTDAKARAIAAVQAI